MWRSNSEEWKRSSWPRVPSKGKYYLFIAAELFYLIFHTGLTNSDLFILRQLASIAIHFNQKRKGYNSMRWSARKGLNPASIVKWHSEGTNMQTILLTVEVRPTNAQNVSRTSLIRTKMNMIEINVLSSKKFSRIKTTEIFRNSSTKSKRGWLQCLLRNRSKNA